MNSLIKAMQQEEINLQPKIRELLKEIEKLSSTEFATACENRLTHKTHNYFVTGYISQLKKVIKLLKAGADTQEALEITDCCVVDVDNYIREMYGKEI